MAGILGKVPTQADVESAYQKWQRLVPWYSTFLPKPAVADPTTQQAEKDYVDMLQAFQTKTPLGQGALSPQAGALSVPQTTPSTAGSKTASVAKTSPALSPEFAYPNDTSSTDASPVPMIVQAMSSGQTGFSPTSGEMAYPNDASNVSPQAAPSALSQAEGWADKLGLSFDRPLARLAMGIGAAGSPDPMGTLLKMKQAEQEAADAEVNRNLLLQRAKLAERQAGQPKRTIVPGVGIMVEGPDGSMEIVSNDKMRPKAPPGYQWTADGSKLEIIPGGPKDPNTEQRLQQNQIALTRLDSAHQTVNDTINKAVGQVGMFSAGPIGQATAWLGGTPGADLEGTLDTLTANIGFKALEDMRAAAPNGASGLGQLAVKELEQLQAVLGSLKQKQSPQQLKDNLLLVQERYNRTYEAIRRLYESAGQQRPSEVRGGGSSGVAPKGGSVENRARGYLD